MANTEFKESTINKITNKFLCEQQDKQNVLNFIRNFFLKRVYAQSIIYNVTPDGSPSTLFFERGNTSSETKYFRKTKTWKHEKEFRIIVSLGGKKNISLGKECIKSIYLGCNISNVVISSIIYQITQLDLTIDLYKMCKLKNGGLAPKKIEWRQYKSTFTKIEQVLQQDFHE